MTTADRTLAALVLARTAAAAVVRPVWRAIDPRAADLASACASMRAREDVDPWGEPWLRGPWNFPNVELFEVVWTGPDRLHGTADDLSMIWTRDRHGESAPFTDLPMTPLEARAGSYRNSPAVPIAIALILLLARWMSGCVELPPTLDARAAAAFLLAMLPALLMLGVLAVSGAPLLQAGLFAGLLSPALGAAGSVYLLFAMAIIAHRNLQQLQTIEVGDERGPLLNGPSRSFDAGSDPSLPVVARVRASFSPVVARVRALGGWWLACSTLLWWQTRPWVRPGLRSPATCRLERRSRGGVGSPPEH